MAQQKLNLTLIVLLIPFPFLTLHQLKIPRGGLTDPPKKVERVTLSGFVVARLDVFCLEGDILFVSFLVVEEFDLEGAGFFGEEVRLVINRSYLPPDFQESPR